MTVKIQLNAAKDIIEFSQSQLLQITQTLQFYCALYT